MYRFLGTELSNSGVQMHGFGVSVDEGARAHGILRDYLANLDGDIGGGG